MLSDVPVFCWLVLLTISQAHALCRSLKTNRLFPTANKPDPMPQNLAFLFTKITPEQMMYMWNVLTATLLEKSLHINIKLICNCLWHERGLEL